MALDTNESLRTNTKIELRNNKSKTGKYVIIQLPQHVNKEH